MILAYLPSGYLLAKALDQRHGSFSKAIVAATRFMSASKSSKAKA